MKIRNIRTTKKAVSAVVGALLLIAISVAALASIHLYLNQSTSDGIHDAEAEFDITISEWEREYMPESADEPGDGDGDDSDPWDEYVDPGHGDGDGDSTTNNAPIAYDDYVVLDETIIEYYNDPISLAFEPIHGRDMAQTFTVTGTCQVSSIKLYLQFSDDSPQYADISVNITENVTDMAYVYDPDDPDFEAPEIEFEYPDLISGNTVTLIHYDAQEDEFDIFDIVNGGWNEFVFDGPFTLEPGTYTIIASSSFNTMEVGIDSDGTYDGGCRYLAEGSGPGYYDYWFTTEGYGDMLFEIEGLETEQIYVLENDDDIDTDALTITGISISPLYGDATIVDGFIEYIPTSSDYPGHDQFEYSISDGKGGTDTAVVYINMYEHYNDPISLAFEPIHGRDMAQTFTVTGTCQVSSIKLYLQFSDDSPQYADISVNITENVTDMAYVYDPDDPDFEAPEIEFEYPDLISGNTVTLIHYDAQEDEFDIFDIVNGGWNEFVFDGPFTLEPGTYTIIASSSFNTMEVGIDSDGTYDGGCRYLAEGSGPGYYDYWFTTEGYGDMLFEIWG